MNTKNKNMLCCVIIIILILVGVFFFLKKNNLLGWAGIKEGFESQPMELNNIKEKPNPDDNTVFVIFFYVDWCPHCVSSKPEWSKLVNEMNNKNVNGKNIKVVANNCEGTPIEKEYAQESNVEGYPSIKIVKKNNVEDYNGARDAESLKNHINNNVN